jgi:flagellar hook-associated protein 1 FlgK
MQANGSDNPHPTPGWKPIFMPSILSGFDTVQQALAAQQFAMSITQRNVANSSNESYTRQEAFFEDVTSSGGSSVSIKAPRDRYIDYSISQELQSLGEQEVTSDALKRIDAIFNENSGQGLQEALSDFFNSFSSLAAMPEDLTLRQQVLAAADALASEFHRLYAGIQQVQASTESAVKDTVDEINSITSRIAELNGKIPSAHASGSEEEFTLRDERQQLLEQLSGLMDLSYYETESGSVTVTTKQGGLLVAENHGYDLDLTSMPNSAFSGIQLNGTDITSSLQSGKLGGLLKVRDSQIPSYLSALDDMAATIIDRANDQHAQGTDLDGIAGGDFFTPFTQLNPGSNTGAARSMSIALSDVRKIAAAGSGGGPGDNENAKLLSAISDEKLFSSSTETANQFYAGLIYRIGLDEQNAMDEVTTQNSVLDQLKNQRDALSGVNLDEEAINLIKYQKAYQASAKFASVLDILSDDILNLLGG